MSQSVPPPCPRCGRNDSVVQAAALMAAMQQMFSARHPAPRAAPSTSSYAGDSLSAEARQEAAEGELILMGCAAIWRYAIWRPFLRPILRRRLAEADQALQEAPSQQFDSLERIVERHPDVWVCERDQVVFRAGSRQTVPAVEALGLLQAGDEATLMSRLGA